MIDRPLNVAELHPPGDWPGLRARAAELLLEATDAAQAGRALFDLIAGELKLNVFLLYAAGSGGGFELVAHGGLSRADAVAASAQSIGNSVPHSRLTGHITIVQDAEDREPDFLRSIGLRAWFGQPLMAGDRLLGIIGFGRRWAGFQDEDLAFLQRIGHYFALALGQLTGDPALRESEERLRLGMAVAGFGTLDVDILGRRVVPSPAVFAILGLPPDRSLTLDQLRDMVHPDDRERVNAARIASRDPDGPGDYSTEHRVIRPLDGAVRWVQVRAKTFFSGEASARRAVRVIGVEQDITEAKLAEQRLETSEERLRLAVEAAGFGVFEYDVERDEAIWSPELRTIYGFGPDEIIDMEKVSRQVHPDDRDMYRAPLSVAGAGGDFDDFSMEFRIFRPDGEMRWVATKARPLFGSGSEHPTRIIGVSHDITERKLAAERLRESEQRLQLAQDLGGVASFDWNHETDETWVSESYRHIFGFAPAAPVNTAIFQAALHPEDRDRVAERFTRIAENAETLEIEYRIIRPLDRKVRWIYSVTGVVRNPATSQIRLSGIAMDITERKRNEEREHLLSREVDHRAKNLLSVVQAMVQLAHAESIPDFVDQVNGRIHALGRVHGLLAASRWDGAELAKLVADELAPFADDFDRSSVTGPSIELKPAAAQSMALVIHELTTNAVKHGALSLPQGRVDVSWEIGPSPDGKLVLHWRERGGPIVEAPLRFGFGMTHIRASVQRQLGGSLAMNWHAEGLECVLVLPPKQFVQTSA